MQVTQYPPLSMKPQSKSWYKKHIKVHNTKYTHQLQSTDFLSCVALITQDTVKCLTWRQRAEYFR